MNYKHQEFQCYEKVLIKSSTVWPELNLSDLTGVVRGKSNVGPTIDFYIVECAEVMNIDTEYRFDCIILPECCLERLEKE